MITVDLTRNVISFEDKSIAVQGRYAEFAHCLLERYPDVTPVYDQIRGMYGNKEPLNVDRRLCDFSYYLHKAIAQIGLGVATFGTRGRTFYLLRDGLPPGAVARGTKPKPERNNQILALSKHGVPNYQIAALMNESPSAIGGVLRRAREL